MNEEDKLAVIPPEPPAINGIFVNVEYDQNGSCRIIGVVPQGESRPSEITDILLLGIKAHQKNLGVG